MKNIFGKKLLPLITAAAITAGAGIVPVSVMAFDAPEPDTGAAQGISNGGEWSIYASKAGYSRNSTAITDYTEKGTVEVTGSNDISAEFQFDMATISDNSAAEGGKVVKSAKLRLTPMVSKTGAQQMLYVIGNDFETTDEKVPVSEFTVPRGNKDDFFSDSEITALTAEGLAEYPAALASWQTAVDITGEAVTAEDKLSFLIEYSSGSNQKTEYATSNIAANARLNGGAVPLLYNGGITEYSKWVYPQVVLEYSDSAVYKNAYADFLNAYGELCAGVVREGEALALSTAQNGSELALEIYGSTSAPIKADGRTLIINDEYAGNEDSAFVRLTVTGTDGEETAQYSRVVSVPAEYTPSNIISFDASKNAKGEPSVTSGGKIYTDGTAYAKTGGSFYVDGGANLGYEAEAVVTNTESGEIISENEDGSYTMPDGDVSVSIAYSKKTYGTTRIAAINSASIMGNGNVQGNSTSAPNIVMGASRLTFVKFDLSDYNPDIISDAEISFNAWNTSNAKAVFYVPNNDWDESSISKNFCLDGTADTNISAFSYTGGTISLYNGTDVASLIVPDGADASTAAGGILQDFYIGSTGVNKTANFDVTEAIKTALTASADQVITLMIYSGSTGGNDASSVLFADSLALRPSLMITESSEGLSDDALVTEIRTVQDLEAFAEIVNGGNSYEGKTVTLAGDLDLTGSSWTPIGTYDIGGTKPFAGTFEGGNHSITFYIDENSSVLGLFGAVTGTIQNLTTAGEINGSSVIGGIAGWCSGTIVNCHSRVNITAQREAGGIVGTLNGGGVISDCDNEGNITIHNKETYAGGIAAHNIGGLIERCSNQGTIENGSDGFRNKLGGIAGYLDNGEICDSHNTGDVLSYAETTSYTADETQNYVGGIVGYSSYGSIQNSSNSGRIYNAVDYTGGIAGFVQTGDVMTDCTNSGSVSGKGYVGGIAGCSYGSISNCRNEAAVAGTGDYIGGVAGYLAAGNLHDCFYDESLNSDLELVGYCSAGTITFTEEPKPSVTVEFNEEKTVIAAVYAENITESAKIILAQYDENGTLVKIDVISVENTGRIETNTAVTGETIRFMLWDHLDTMKPLCDSVEMKGATD